MKRVFTRLAIATVVFCLCCSVVVQICPGQNQAANDNVRQSNKTELSDLDRKLLILRIKHLLEKDQQFRSYLSFGTTDETEISRLKKLDVKQQLQAMSRKSKGLSGEIKKLLTELQLRNDREVLTEFVEIVRKYGYPSPERLGMKTDQLFVVLLHPPVKRENMDKHIDDMIKLLKPEVLAGRMPAKRFAMFVDNMHGKIMKRPQIYGTNQMYDPATRKILPPVIGSLERANKARREIGLPELKDGEYRIAQLDKVPGKRMIEFP